MGARCSQCNCPCPWTRKAEDSVNDDEEQAHQSGADTYKEAVARGRSASLPAAVIERRRSSLLFKAFDAPPQENTIRFNIVMYGDKGVGKTCLRNRWVEGRYTPECVASTGVDFNLKMLQVGQDNVKVNVYDTSGKHFFRRVGQLSYLRGFAGVIFTYDVTDKRTLHALRDFLVTPEAQTALRGVGPAGTGAKAPPVMMLIGCKADCGTQEREVGTETGTDLAMELGMEFAETSAKAGQGVDAAFHLVVGPITERLVAAAKKQAAQAQQPRRSIGAPPTDFGIGASGLADRTVGWRASVRNLLVRAEEEAVAVEAAEATSPSRDALIADRRGSRLKRIDSQDGANSVCEEEEAGGRRRRGSTVTERSNSPNRAGCYTAGKRSSPPVVEQDVEKSNKTFLKTIAAFGSLAHGKQQQQQPPSHQQQPTTADAHQHGHPGSGGIGYELIPAPAFGSRSPSPGSSSNERSPRRGSSSSPRRHNLGFTGNSSNRDHIGNSSSPGHGRGSESSRRRQGDYEDVSLEKHPHHLHHNHSHNPHHHQHQNDYNGHEEDKYHHNRTATLKQPVSPPSRPQMTRSPAARGTSSTSTGHTGPTSSCSPSKYGDNDLSCCGGNGGVSCNGRSQSPACSRSRSTSPAREALRQTAAEMLNAWDLVSSGGAKARGRTRRRRSPSPQRAPPHRSGSPMMVRV